MTVFPELLRPYLVELRPTELLEAFELFEHTVCSHGYRFEGTSFLIDCEQDEMDASNPEQQLLVYK